jgi:integrase
VKSLTFAALQAASNGGRCRYTSGETTNLHWSDVELKQGRVLLRKTRNPHLRTVWLHGEALRLLVEHTKVRRLNDDRVFVNPIHSAARMTAHPMAS